MAADPEDIARYTTDGVLVVAPSDPAVSAAIQAAHIDARDGSGTEIEHFFDDPADSQAMLDELFALRSRVDPVYLAVEIDDSIGIGSAIPVAPAVPCFRIIDAGRGLDQVVRVRGYAANFATDRFSVELIQ